MSRLYVTDGIEVGRPEAILPSRTELYRMNLVDSTPRLVPGLYAVTADHIDRVRFALRISETVRPEEVADWVRSLEGFHRPPA